MSPARRGTAATVSKRAVETAGVGADMEQAVRSAAATTPEREDIRITADLLTGSSFNLRTYMSM
ncbi:hypothetical protein GCM10008956_31570 [Deinococcus arenae]|uniref:Uncharacterized protein n=1 Tax=Deinococcus arenae TaxID=1452751 RepID=A0A8H9LA13_9DEIO|nr:hypothetical protein GCM10008956_31570 [Deinococcus arenae]